MEPGKSIDFLSKPSPIRLRKEIQNICDSYNNPWDLLAELCQNSVDAIRLHLKKFGEMSKEHKIIITINSEKRSIKIYDTGIGIPISEAVELLGPHCTNKKPEDKVIGEKGVGLTYTIFNSNKYLIKSKSLTGYFKGDINKGSLWKEGLIDEIPKFKVIDWEDKKNKPKDTFTEIDIEGVEEKYEESEDIFYQSFPVIEYILRTKTAIGSTNKIFNNENENEFDVELIYLNRSGEEAKKNIEPFYILPSEFIPKKDIINIQDFIKEAAMLSDDQRTKKLRKKCIFEIGSVGVSGRKIDYYAFFSHTRKIWKEISEKSGLYYTDTSEEKNYLYKPGIYIATRGMPTGIRLEPPIIGEAGYWPNFYIVIEDDSITFDLGRKSIPSRTKGIFNDICGKIFNNLSKFQKYLSSDPIVDGTIATIQQYEKNKQFSALSKLPKLGIEEIKYLKQPDSQEGGVVALFHELVGADILKGYYSLTTGYKMAYDLWGKYRIHKDLIGPKYAKIAKRNGIIETNIIIEFKFFAESILEDFKDNKYFSDIDLLVCWDLNDRKFANKGVDVEILRQEDVFFYGSNYKLNWAAAYNLGSAGEKPVIVLRKFIEDYIREK